jgi:hypothetical protein
MERHYPMGFYLLPSLLVRLLWDLFTISSTRDNLFGILSGHRAADVLGFDDMAIWHRGTL